MLKAIGIGRKVLLPRLRLLSYSLFLFQFTSLTNCQTNSKQHQHKIDNNNDHSSGGAGEPSSLAPYYYYYYSDKAYYDYASEYQDNLRVSAVDIHDDDYDNDDHLVDDTDSDMEQARREMTSSSSKENYTEMASRLKCDNPWFWNAIKCAWLDVKMNRVGERTKRNASTSAWLIGSVTTLLFSWLCGFYCLYLWKARNRIKLRKLRKKYEPGRIELANGKVAKFQPTKEEIKAYEELVKAIIIQEMASMI